MAKSRAQQAAIAISMKKAGKKPKSLPKAQKGMSVKPTADSTAYFKKMQDFHYKQAATNAKYGLRDAADKQMRSAIQAVKDEFRQSNKGKPGYDKDGFPIKKSTTKKKG